MYQVLKPLLFKLAPEKAHHLTVQGLAATLATPGVSQAFRATYRFEDAGLERKLFGLPFPNPVGLAAGFDKDGKYYHDMANLGFGFLELGTVTPPPPGRQPPTPSLSLATGSRADQPNGFQQRGRRGAGATTAETGPAGAHDHRRQHRQK